MVGLLAVKPHTDSTVVRHLHRHSHSCDATMLLATWRGSVRFYNDHEAKKQGHWCNVTRSTYRFALRAEPLYWLKDGEPLDHNVCERAIKNVILGRKSWLLAASLGAGKHSAQIMSLLVTAKRNGLEPHPG